MEEAVRDDRDPPPQVARQKIGPQPEDAGRGEALEPAADGPHRRGEVGRGTGPRAPIEEGRDEGRGVVRTGLVRIRAIDPDGLDRDHRRGSIAKHEHAGPGRCHHPERVAAAWRRLPGLTKGRAGAAAIAASRRGPSAAGASSWPAGPSGSATASVSASTVRTFAATFWRSAGPRVRRRSR